MIKIISATLLGWLATAQIALAQFNIPEGHFDPSKNSAGSILTGPSRLGDLMIKIKEIILSIQDEILKIAGLIIVLMLVYGGIQYITNQAEAGKKTITAAIVGGFIIGLAIAIINLVISLIK